MPKIEEDFVVARVQSAAKPELNKLLKENGITSRQQLVKVQILEGPLKDQTILVPNEITDNPAFNIEATPGRELILSVVSADGAKPEFEIADYHRAPSLLLLGFLFLAAFLWFGGRNSLKSLIGLVAAILLIGFVLLPLSLSGFNPLVSSVIICFAAACITIFCVAGFSKKSAAALIGTAGGVIIAGLASYLVVVYTPLTGLSSEEAQILRGSVINQPPSFFAGLLSASMLIGALGVIMDVAISIASAVSEISDANDKLDGKDLYARGMNVGRDIMGSMTSTLVLAYAGTALPLLLLMASTPSIKLVNLDLVATEIASALTGSLGLVCTIPLTAVAAARLMQRDRKSTDIFAGLDCHSRNIGDNDTPQNLQRNTTSGQS